MPIRSTSSLNRQIHHNGARLHQAMASRVHSQGADQPASEAETALLEERRALKEAKATQQAQPRAAKPKPAWQMKTAQAPKAPKAPKALKAPKEAKEAKAAKGGEKTSRADKQSKKAANAEAADKAARKSAKS